LENVKLILIANISFSRVAINKLFSF